MRRRSIIAERTKIEEAQKLRERQELMNMKQDSNIQVVNSNLISRNAQPELKEKANIFLPHVDKIKQPDGKPAGRKRK